MEGTVFTSGAVAIKEFFKDSPRPIENSELLHFAKVDRIGYDEVAQLCAAAMGGSIAVKA